MKNKSILIVIVLCVGLQSNISFSVQQPSWTERIRSAVSNWWNKGGGSTSVQTGAVVGGLTPAAVLAVGVASPDILGVQDLSLSMNQETLLRGAGATIAFAGIGAVSAVALNLMRQAWEKYVTGTISESDVKTIIKNAIEKSFLSKCPTKQTKLDLLNNHQNYFSAKLERKGINVKEQEYQNLINEVCKELIDKINDMEATAMQINTETKIDQSIQTSESGLNPNLPTKDKIAVTECNIAAQAYLLFKLKNQLIQESARAVQQTMEDFEENEYL